MPKMTNEKKSVSNFVPFLGYVVLADIICAIVLLWPVYYLHDGYVMISIMMGLVLTTLTFIPVYYLTERNYQGSMNEFMGTVFGAVFGKMLVFGAAIVLVFIYSFLHEIAFTIGVLISYIYKSVIEIIFILRTQKSLQQKSND